MGFKYGYELIDEKKITAVELARKVRDEELTAYDANNPDEPIDWQEKERVFNHYREKALGLYEVIERQFRFESSIDRRPPPPPKKKSYYSAIPYDKADRQDWETLFDKIEFYHNRSLPIESGQYRALKEGWGLNIIQDYALKALYDEDDIEEAYSGTERKQHLLVIYYLMQMLKGKATLGTGKKRHPHFHNQELMRTYIHEQAEGELAKNPLNDIFKAANDIGKEHDSTSQLPNEEDAL